MTRPKGKQFNVGTLIVGLLVVGALAYAFMSLGNGASTETAATNGSDASRAHASALVQPGELDDYYMFASGGHSGQIYVYGIPSMRRLRTIPVFTPDPISGYGYDDDSKEMLGGFTWGDTHHPRMSKTDGLYDGRWLFINDNANNRIARINLNTFLTEQIVGPLPNMMGAHGGASITQNTELLFVPARFWTPVPVGTYAPIDEFSEEYLGIASALSIDSDTGEMDLAWQMKLPPWSWDLASSGKGASDGWVFFTSYNTEEATTRLEINASQRDKDYIIAINWRLANEVIAEGKYEIIDGAKVIDPLDTPGIAYLLPIGKSPHGVDVSPTGEYIVGSGKLSPTVTVFEWDLVKKAIDAENFQGHEWGLPILTYEDVRLAEVPVGLGPLHTEFDDKGFAYTSMFLESGVTKWSMETWEVVDKISAHYNVGHLTVAGGSTAKPYGEWLVALTKQSKDRFLGVGPGYPENLQLIDISGDKMELIADAPSDPEPHNSVIVKADVLDPWEVFPRDQNDHPHAIWHDREASIERDGDEVTIRMAAIRSHFTPDIIEVNEGDKVTIHITNIDEEPDITHGFGIALYDINLSVNPGQTKSVSFVADKPGVYTFYCTDFCSALHQEMTGHLLVKPKADEAATN